MASKSSKLNADKYTVEVTVDSERKYTIWIHNKTIDEHVNIMMKGPEYVELCQLLERMRYDG